MAFNMVELDICEKDKLLFVPVACKIFTAVLMCGLILILYPRMLGIMKQRYTKLQSIPFDWLKL